MVTHYDAYTVPHNFLGVTMEIRRTRKQCVPGLLSYIGPGTRLPKAVITSSCAGLRSIFHIIQVAMLVLIVGVVRYLALVL